MTVLTLSEAARGLRAVGLANDPILRELQERSPAEAADFLAGKCQVRCFEGTLIVDYTKPWGRL